MLNKYNIEKCDLFYQDSMHFFEGIKAEWDLVEKKTVLHACYCHYGMVLVDFFLLPKFKRRVDKHLVKIPNESLDLKMIDGKHNKFQKIVEINAGAALYLSGIADNIKVGCEIASKSINEGKTKNFIKKIING